MGQIVQICAYIVLYQHRQLSSAVHRQYKQPGLGHLGYLGKPYVPMVFPHPSESFRPQVLILRVFLQDIYVLLLVKGMPNSLKERNQLSILQFSRHQQVQLSEYIVHKLLLFHLLSRLQLTQNHWNNYIGSFFQCNIQSYLPGVGEMQQSYFFKSYLRYLFKDHQRYPVVWFEVLITPDVDILLVELHSDLGGDLYVYSVVVFGDWVELVRVYGMLDVHELPLHPYFLPVLSFAQTQIHKLLLYLLQSQIYLPTLRQYPYLRLALLKLCQRVCPLTYRNKTVLLKLLYLVYVVKRYYVPLSKVLRQQMVELRGILYFMYLSGTSCQILKHLSYLQLPQRKVTSMQFGIGLLYQHWPQIILYASSELRMANWFTGYRVIYCDALPLPVFAYPQPINSPLVNLQGTQEQPFDEGWPHSQTSENRKEGLIVKLPNNQVVRVYFSNEFKGHFKKHLWRSPLSDC